MAFWVTFHIIKGTEERKGYASKAKQQNQSNSGKKEHRIKNRRIKLKVEAGIWENCAV